MKDFMMKQFLVAVILLKKIATQEYIGPRNFSRINNGCYFFETTTTDATNARKNCEDLNLFPGAGVPNRTLFHLLTLESEPEAIGMTFWLKGNNLNFHYWLDGVMKLRDATHVTPAYVEPMWRWSDQSAFLFDYLKSANLRKIDKYNMYLHFNGTGPEYRSETGANTTNIRSICEASVPCQANENQCQNNGTCYINSGRVLCKCPHGYVGYLCQSSIDYCDSVPCQHGGSCKNNVNNYTCTCTEFYTGVNCEIAVSYKYAEFRKAVLFSWIAVVGSIITLLCLMDLPWNGILKRLNLKKNYKAKTEEEAGDYREEERSAPVDESENPSKTRTKLYSADEEILRKLQQTIATNNNSAQIRNRTAVGMQF